MYHSVKGVPLTSVCVGCGIKIKTTCFSLIKKQFQLNLTQLNQLESVGDQDKTSWISLTGLNEYSTGVAEFSRLW